MKRTYKPLSLMYLLVTNALVFQGSIRAEGPEIVSEPISVESGKAAAEQEELEKKEQQQAIQAEEKSKEGQLSAGIETEQQTELAPKDTSEASVSSWITRLGESATSLGQQGKESVIKITTSAIAQVKDAWIQLRSEIDSIVSRLRSLIGAPAVALTPEQNEALSGVLVQARSIADGIGATVEKIGTELTSQKDIGAQASALNRNVIELATNARNFIRENPEAREANEALKNEVVAVLTALRDATPRLANPFAPERETLLQNQLGKLDAVIAAVRQF